MELITLSISGYTNTTGVAGLGRVTLKGGYRYKISGHVRSLGATTFYGYSIYNASTGSRIGTYGGGYASSSQNLNAGNQESHAFVS